MVSRRLPQLSAAGWIVVAVTVIFGGLVLWLQIGVLTSAATLAIGARGMQTSLTSAVNQIKAGDFSIAQSDISQATASGHTVNSSAYGPHMALLARLPGLSTAIANWRQLGNATGGITDATGKLVALYGDLMGKNGGHKIFSNGTIDINRLKQVPPRVAAIDVGIRQVIADLQQINTSGPAAGVLSRLQTKALQTAHPVQSAITSLQRIAPYLPDALGANGPKRYLIAIDNQAEMRASGGAPLTLVMVELNNGRITIPIKGQTSTQLFPPLNAKVTWWGPGGNPFFAANPRYAAMVVTNTHPAMTISGQEMAGAWAGGKYPAVDGVISMDLTAIGAMLNAVGPVQSPAYGAVTGDRLGQILLIEAYQTYGQNDAAARQIANQALVNAVLNKLLSGNQVVTAAQAVVRTAPGRHFQAWMRSQPLESLAVSSGAGGQVLDPPTGDWSAAYTQNGNQSKVDVFQQRNVVVNVQLAADGSAHVIQQMNVTNATPASRPALGPLGKIGYGTSWLKAAYLMYVPNAATNYIADYPVGFLIRPFTNHRQYGNGFVDDGYGQKLVRVVGWTPPGGQSAISVSYDLPAGTFTSGTGLHYALQALPQSIWNPATLTVRVTPPAGWAPTDQSGMSVVGGVAQLSAVQNQTVNVAIDFHRGSQ